jgi:hypothetical protein
MFDANFVLIQTRASSSTANALQSLKLLKRQVREPRHPSKFTFVHLTCLQRPDSFASIVGTSNAPTAQVAALVIVPCICQRRLCFLSCLTQSATEAGERQARPAVAHSTSPPPTTRNKWHFEESSVNVHTVECGT